MGKLLSLIVGLLLAAGCLPQPAELEPYTAGDDRPPVVLFGDSLSAFGRVPTLAAWEGRRVSFNAEAGTSIDDWFAAMEVVPDDAVVVVALGTNDVTQDTHMVSDVDIVGALGRLEGHCVVWLTLFEEGGEARGTPFSSRTRWFNQTLRAAPVHVFEWDDMASMDMLAADGLHHNEQGIVAYGQALIAAAEMCP